MAALGVEPVDDALHLDGEIHCPMNVVQPRHCQPATGQVAVVGVAHRFDSVSLGGRVELAGQFVDQLQRRLGLQPRGEFVETDQVGEDHRDVLVLLGDRLLTIPVALHHRLRHQREQQPVVLGALFSEELILDRQIAAHIVERLGEITELVVGVHRQRDVVVAGADLLGADLQPPDRPDEHPGPQHGGQAGDEDDESSGADQSEGEVALGGERLVGVDRGDDRPVQTFEVQRGVGLQGAVAEVVGGDQRSGLTALGCFGRLGPDRLDQDGRALPHGAVGHLRRRSGRDDVFAVGLRILEEQPRIGAHQVVLADQESLPGGAHSDPLPLSVGGHQPVDDGGRVFNRHDPDRTSRRSDRHQHPRGGLTGGQVLGEIGGVDIVDVVGGHRFPERIRQHALPAERAGQDVGTQFHALVGAVDDVPAWVYEQGVPKPHPSGDLPEVPVEPRVGLRPGAAVLGVIDLHGLVAVGEGHGVGRLKVLGCVGGRQQRSDIEAAVVGAAEPLLVVLGDRLGLSRGGGGVGEFIECGVEGRQGVGHRLPAREDNQRTGDVVQSHLQHPGLSFADAGQAVEDRGAQRGPAGLEADAAGDGGRQHTHQQQHQHQLGLDADPFQQAAFGTTSPQPLG